MRGKAESLRQQLERERDDARIRAAEQSKADEERRAREEAWVLEREVLVREMTAALEQQGIALRKEEERVQGLREREEDMASGMRQLQEECASRLSLRKGACAGALEPAETSKLDATRADSEQDTPESMSLMAARMAEEAASATAAGLPVACCRHSELDADHRRLPAVPETEPLPETTQTQDNAGENVSKVAARCEGCGIRGDATRIRSAGQHHGRLCAHFRWDLPPA